MRRWWRESVDYSGAVVQTTPGSSSVTGVANDNNFGSARTGFGWRQRDVELIDACPESG